jgi:hypothetical protein
MKLNVLLKQTKALFVVVVMVPFIFMKSLKMIKKEIIHGLLSEKDNFNILKDQEELHH